jgi:iron complex outermembrane receptor protein
LVSLDFKWAAPQNNIVPPEEKTAGYHTVNISASMDFPFKKQNLSAVLKVNNLLNTTYFNHMSYYRIIGIPEPGRSLILSLKLEF